MLFTFLNPIIFKAYRTGDLSYDELPPLADSDESMHLISKHLPKLDPVTGTHKERHLFWGLMSIFRVLSNLKGSIF